MWGGWQEKSKGKHFMAFTVAPHKKYNALATPDDHLALLTDGLSDSQHGTVLVGWQPLQTPKWFRANLARAQDQLSGYTNEPDIYLTPNLFHNWRLTRLLQGLTAFYVDIDCHDGSDVDMFEMRADVQDVIDSNIGIPSPNFIVYTGRGLHLYWLLDNVPPQALPRWQAVQTRLCALFGGDKRARDATRLLRVVGTVNRKTGHTVTGEFIHDHRHDFNLVCDEILPYTQAQVRDFTAAKLRIEAKEKCRKKKSRQMRKLYQQTGERWAQERESKGTAKRSGSIYARWHVVYQDLIRIQNWFWFGGIREEGYRNHMLFHTANALSWFTVSDALTSEIKATARIITPTFTDAEVMSYCSSVVRRARLTQQGDQEHRYKYSREKLWEEFEPLVGGEPDLVQSLRAIIPEGVREERQAERDRVAEGRYKERRTDSVKQRREVRKLLSQGFSQKYIAEQLGVQPARISKIVKELKK
jgi:hypothetical protein